MADLCNSRSDKLSATAAQSAMVGMVISGRAARACDVCGKERARWYCAADMAYLCERCDGAVHSANAVAGRHERVRLGPNGTPMKMKSTPAVYVKREASTAVVAHPSAHFNPRKRPRSIRRHKPSSLHASKHAIGLSIQASNHNRVSSHASSYNIAGSILASTHGVMIDNPRSNPDFIANINSNELFIKSITVKAEPYSPVDVCDQVKVPDHLDDDHLLESLFDFRDMQDDDLFLQQVPIYNPLQILPTLDSVQEQQEHEEKKPIINIITSWNDCANAHPPELSQAAEDGEGMAFRQHIEDNDAPFFANCDDGDRSVDPNSDICDFDQLDFDCVLQGNIDEESVDTNHSSMDMEINSHDYADVYPRDATEDSGFAEVSYDDHDNCNMDDADCQYESEQHSGYVAELDFNAILGSESPRTWLSKVKVESPQELGSLPGRNGELYDNALLREKLSTCEGLSSDSPASFKLGLKLNFEDVVRSWSDRGTFWTDGHRPSQVGNCLDFLGGCFVPEMSVPRTEGEGTQMVPVLNNYNKQIDGSAREASVLRYREKRRTRLFSKKIRYEVRKLNAEKRPRMKGRFIKRIAI